MSRKKPKSKHQDGMGQLIGDYDQVVADIRAAERAIEKLPSGVERARIRAEIRQIKAILPGLQEELPRLRPFRICRQLATELRAKADVQSRAGHPDAADELRRQAAEVDEEAWYAPDAPPRR
jgi:hypothetical protein